MINKEQVFPFKLRAYDTGMYISNPRLAEIIWLRVRPNGLTWYALDIEFISEDEVTITVYNHQQNFDIGKVVHVQNAKIEGEEEQKHAKEHILNRCATLAKEEVERRDQEVYQQRLLKVRREMFGI
jgi:hypothetical protein